MFTLRRWSPIEFPLGQRQRSSYYAALVIGAAVFAFALGTANLWLSHRAGVARSIEGALFGAILGVELYKWRAGLSVRTGAIFALPLTIGIAVGRVGCYLAGLDDFTYGTPTGLPWGHDFGDGVPRHPVQLYEAGTMLGFALVYIAALVRGRMWPVTYGFPLVVLLYGSQRFLWEFFKPYGPLIGTLSLFQVISVLLIIYALMLLRGTIHAAPGRADR